MSPVARPRAAGFALTLALAMLAGCGRGPAPMAAPAPATAAVATSVTSLTLAPTSSAGRIEIQVKGLGGYHLQATVGQVVTLRVTLSGGGLSAPVSKDVSAAGLSSGSGTVSFDGIPPGNVNVAIEALDADGNSLGTSQGTTTVAGGQTAVVNVALQLDPTHVTNPNGGVTVGINVTDGEVIVDPVASPSTQPSSPALSPAPSPTPTPSPTPGTVGLYGDLVKSWFPNKTMGVQGVVQNTWTSARSVKLTATFYKRTLFGYSVEETQTKDFGTMTGGASASFELDSTGAVSNWLGEGDARVTIDAE